MKPIIMKNVIYEKSVLEPWFSLIQNGVKKVEGRPKKECLIK